jgi:hypothetical protein
MKLIPSVMLRSTLSGLEQQKNANAFKILIHIEVVEDLLFYHYPREELLADGKVPWREFVWHYGKPDGEVDEEELLLATRYCGPQSEPRWCYQDEDDNDRNQKHSKSQGFFGKVSNWIDGRSGPKNRMTEGQGSGRFAGESSHGKRARPEPSSLSPAQHESQIIRMEAL